MGLIFSRKKESLTLGDLFKMLANNKKLTKKVIKHKVLNVKLQMPKGKKWF